MTPRRAIRDHRDLDRTSNGDIYVLVRETEMIPHIPPEESDQHRDVPHCSTVRGTAPQLCRSSLLGARLLRVHGGPR